MPAVARFAVQQVVGAIPWTTSGCVRYPRIAMRQIITDRFTPV